jgi:hypothetical protein
MHIRGTGANVEVTMDEPREMEPHPEQDTTAERIARAGSRANAARRAARRFASEELVPLEAWVSYPVPIHRPFGPALTVFLAQAEADVEARDYLVYEPEVRVTLDAEEVRPLGYEIWRETVEPDIESPVSLLLPARARELASWRRDALEQELLLLLDTVAPLYWFDYVPSPSEHAAVQRYDLLWRFLVPSELFPYYLALNRTFFDWLQVISNSPGLVQIEIAPEPAKGIVPPPRLVPEPWEAPAEMDAWDAADDPFAVTSEGPGKEEKNA